MSCERLTVTSEVVQRVEAKKGSQRSAVFTRKEQSTGEDSEES